MEVWKDVIDYEGYYQVSNTQKVRSVDRLRWGGNKIKTFYKTKGRVLTQRTDRGYKLVGLWKNNKEKNCRVHRLVAAAFIGKCPDGYDCRHKNGIRDDNVPSNLEYGTRSENEMDKVLHGKDQRGEKHWNSKLTARKVNLIKWLYKTKLFTQNQIAEMYGVHQWTISGILLGKTWKWLKYDLSL